MSIKAPRGSDKPFIRLSLLNPKGAFLYKLRRNKLSFVICSYYTQNTDYEEVAHNYLMKSIGGLNIKSDIRCVPNLGSWAKNTSYKPQFILEMLEQHTDNIVFVDCDAEIVSYPELFENIPADCNFAAHILDRSKWYGVKFEEQNSKELLSGTLWIRNNKESRTIVQEWNMACKISPVWEQKVLGMVLKKNDVHVYQLPIEYCYIKTLPSGEVPIVKCNDPVIVHNQCSRLYRNKIK